MSYICIQQNRHHHSRAFTLIELLVVISIIGLLSSVVMAAISGARKQGTIAAGQKFDQHTHSAFYDDLVLSWDFDRDSGGVVQDLSGNGNNLSLAGGATLDGPPTPNPFKTGKVITVDSSRTASMTGIKESPVGNFSISFWLYPKSNEAVNYFSFYAVTLSNVGRWKFAYQDPQNGFVYTYDDGVPKTLKLLPLLFNTWNHVALVCGGTKLGVYINGKISNQINGLG